MRGWLPSGWSARAALNFLLLGQLGPFMAALIDGFGSSARCFARWRSCSPARLHDRALAAVPDLGSDDRNWVLGGAIGFATAVVNRWFVKNRGLAIGLMMSANAAVN